MRLLVLDFETKDPYLSKELNLGPGWVYMIHNPTAKLAFPIGFSFCFIENNIISEPKYLAMTEQNLGALKDLVRENKNIIMHNAQYDLGYLLACGVSISDIQVYDTKVMAKLYNNTLERGVGYHLEGLSDLYLSKDQQKEKFNLIEVVRANKLISMSAERKSFSKKAIDFAYSNMDLIQKTDFEAMARYAKQDIVATANLFIKFIAVLGYEFSNYWSNFQLICVKNRAKGLNIDMNIISKGIEVLEPAVKKLQDSIYKLAGTEFNLNSPKQLIPILEKQLNRKITSTSKDSISLLQHPIIKAILDYREANKILNDYFITTRDMQIYTCPLAAAGRVYGKVFPQMNMLEAKTGRFSSSSPNIQKIPKRSELYGNLCRSMFIPSDPKNKWYSLDWANQEGRLAVNDAVLIYAEGAEKLPSSFIENPKLDLHQKVAELCKITRSQAKSINLGLIYSLGQAKLCKNLGLSTKFIQTERGMLEVAGDEGQELLDKYHKYNPWLKELNETAKKSLQKKGYIRTLGNRLLKRTEKKYDYRALNSRIQGSAADQMYWALYMADKENVDIKCVVHDEFNVEGEESAKKMKEIMESKECYNQTFKIPMVAEVKSGTSWGTLQKEDNV